MSNALRYTLIVCLFISGFVPQEVSGQIKLLKAKVVSSKDSSILIGVHVVDLNSQYATNSFSDGTFLLPYTQNDTIRLTSIGFEDKYIYTNTLFIPDAIEITIFMTEKVYSLKEVDVSIYSDKEEFAEDFKNQEVTTEAVESYGYEKPKSIDEVDTDLNAHIPLGSPISFLYSKFSKEAKEQKRMKKAVVQSDRERIIQSKYNPLVVQRITGLSSEEAAKEFMKNCPLEDEFVLRAVEYDIVKAIKDCQEKSSK